MDLVEHVLRALDEGLAEWPLSSITELYIFGSFVRGAIEPHDVDIDAEFEIDRRWACGVRDPGVFLVNAAQAFDHVP